MQKFRLKLKPADIVILILCLLLITVSALWAYGRPDTSLQVVIQSAESQWIYPLDQDRELTLETTEGPLTIEIRNSEVRVTEADCPDKLCIYKGTINRAGQWIACMPSRVMITIEGNNEDEIDDVAY